MEKQADESPKETSMIAGRGWSGFAFVEIGVSSRL